MKSRSKMTKGLQGGVLLLVFVLVGLVATPALAQDGTWTTMAPMPANRWAHAAVEVSGTIYIVGGNEGSSVSSGSIFAYDLASDAWTTKAAMLAGRSSPGAGAVNGKIFVFGGGNYWGAVTSTEVYDPATNTWTNLAPMNHPRGGGVPASGAVNGMLYAAGGDTSGTTEVYDPVSNTWTDVAPMPSPRFYVGGAAIGSVLYVVGGHNASGTVDNTVYAYDTASNTWSTKAPLPTPRMNPTVAVVDGILYVVGGSQHSSGYNIQLDTVEAYNPSTDEWTTEASIPGCREQAAATASRKHLYVAGGLKQDGCTSSFYNDTDIPDLISFTQTLVDAQVSRAFVSGSGGPLHQLAPNNPLLINSTLGSTKPTTTLTLTCPTSLEAGQRGTCTVTTNVSQNTTAIPVSSSNRAVLTVPATVTVALASGNSATFTITGVARGTATITVGPLNRTRATARVTVIMPNLFNGTYRGRYNGDFSSRTRGAFPLSGDVAFTLNGTIMNVTQPFTGRATLAGSGLAFGGRLNTAGLRANCNFTGTLHLGRSTFADGGWACTFPSDPRASARGTWGATRQ